MKKNFFLILGVLFLQTHFLFCQEIQTIFKGENADSSIYDIERINANEFWMAGEYGILKKIDTSGNIKNIDYPNDGKSILKITKTSKYLFLATDDGTIYKYDIQKQTFFKKEFPQFKNRCFYDIMAINDTVIIACGGHTKISKDKKVVPFGFIVKFNDNFQNVVVLWKNIRKFALCLQQSKDSIYASIFDGISTKIISFHKQSYKSQSVKRVRGLIHKLFYIDNQLWYCGSKQMRFFKNGIIGKVSDVYFTINQSGCIWSMEISDNMILGVTANRYLLFFNKENFKKGNCIYNSMILPALFTYDVEKITSNKILLAGHGKSICILTLNPSRIYSEIK